MKEDPRAAYWRLLLSAAVRAAKKEPWGYLRCSRDAGVSKDRADKFFRLGHVSEKLPPLKNIMRQRVLPLIEAGHRPLEVARRIGGELDLPVPPPDMAREIPVPPIATESTDEYQARVNALVNAQADAVLSRARSLPEEAKFVERGRKMASNAMIAAQALLGSCAPLIDRLTKQIQEPDKDMSPADGLRAIDAILSLGTRAAVLADRVLDMERKLVGDPASAVFGAGESRRKQADLSQEEATAAVAEMSALLDSAKVHIERRGLTLLPGGVEGASRSATGE